LPAAQQDGNFDIIRKPFTQAELAAAFARVRVASVAEIGRAVG
jgi:hypothetical protein